jgi:site-specific recombinase XerD
VNNRCSTYRVKYTDAKSIMNYHLQELEGYHQGTIHLHKNVIGNLLSNGGCKSMYLNCTEQALLRWMIADAKGKGNHCAAIRLQIVNRYIKSLCKHNLLPDNPLRRIKPRDADPSWNSVVEILQSSNPWQKLRRLHHYQLQNGPLYKYIQKYIDLQQSLGKKYATHKYTLHHLDGFLMSNGVNRLKAVKADHVRQWLDSMQCGKRLQLTKLLLVKRYIDYLVGIGLLESNPVAPLVMEFGRTPASRFKPFIFTKSQIKSLLEHAMQLPYNHLFKLRPQVCYTMFVLLYALGLRNGEVCNLRFSDVDMDKGILHIKGTKFHKSRMVPFGPQVQECLSEYMAARNKVFLPIKPDDPLFIAYRRQPIRNHTLESLLRNITDKAIPHVSPKPRIHDLRHTFAVHRLLRWYQDGDDVQSKLILLSTFMGHTEISSTEVYLTITMDLLKEANNRFYKHFGKEMHI